MAKRKNQLEIRERKAAQLIERTAAALQTTPEAARMLLSTGLRPSVRINTLKSRRQEILNTLEQLGWKGSQNSWCPEGYSVLEGFEALRDSRLINDGTIYIQNASSWIPVVLLDPQPGDSVLDVCAAPGGKTSHIAGRMQNQGRLVANDNSRPRLIKLQQNMQRLGAHADYTLHDATNLSRQFEGELFHKILLDAPCSGEGLINLNNPKSVDTWSVAHIRRLAELQKRILHEAWQLLEQGGTLVYSTCTIAPEENEAVITSFLAKHQDATILPTSLPIKSADRITAWNDRALNSEVVRAIRVTPGTGDEAFFACALYKQS